MMIKTQSGGSEEKDRDTQRGENTESEVGFVLFFQVIPTLFSLLDLVFFFHVYLFNLYSSARKSK